MYRMQDLSREVTDNIGCVSPPECNHTLIFYCAGEAITDTFIRMRKPTTFDRS